MSVPFTSVPAVEGRLPRRTHAERSAATRTALLDATLECLADIGYARTSTTEIVRRAGVSRGAQVHHFPTKSQLVLAALEHLLERRRQEFRLHFSHLAPEDRTPAAALEVMWEVFDRLSFRALIQFMIAALTDDELKPLVAVVLGDLDRLVVELYSELFPDRLDLPFVVSALRFVLRSVETAALYRELGLIDEANEMFNVLHQLSTMPADQATALWTPAETADPPRAAGATDPVVAVEPAGATELPGPVAAIERDQPVDRRIVEPRSRRSAEH